ncbi:hypothetical protein B296_00035775 [Ensete ventricosum]|uniref:Uncharacterized protein n=1 Tax=Ensete ventricosum TaxID=4639 RepID=A0A426XYE3_ENSVE|nr:hypothetical protein B296_00035775 [Ensete ventricosum]
MLSRACNGGTPPNEEAFKTTHSFLRSLDCRRLLFPFSAAGAVSPSLLKWYVFPNPSRDPSPHRAMAASLVPRRSDLHFIRGPPTSHSVLLRPPPQALHLVPAPQTAPHPHKTLRLLDWDFVPFNDDL